MTAECAQTISKTCPSTLDWDAFGWYTVNVLVYVWVAWFAYHRFVESDRMTKRVEKVAQLQQDDSTRCAVTYQSDCSAERVWPGSSKKSMPTVME